MKKQVSKDNIISLKEFIDIITDNRGEEIKRQIREIELKSKEKGNKREKKEKKKESYVKIPCSRTLPPACTSRLS